MRRSSRRLFYTMSVIPESHADLLTKPTFWHIATMGPQDEIQSSPVWAGWDGEHFLFSLTRGRQKYENLVRNPTVAVSGIDPDNPYRYLEIRGTVVRVDDDSSNAFIDSMAKKYMGVDRSTFLIDRQGRIARIWRQVRVPGHAEEVLGAVKALVG